MTTQQVTPGPTNHEVEITVNDKPVTVLGPKTTGFAIKEAAIAQHVPIQLDFVLSEEIGPKKTRVVHDDDPVTVNPHSKFVAIPDDDNS